MRRMLRTKILADFLAVRVVRAPRQSRPPAAGPDRSDIGSLSVDFPAGVLCDFAVRWEFDAGGHELVFPGPAQWRPVRAIGWSG